MHHQVVWDPAGAWKSWMPHQTVQLLAIHAPQGVQGVVGGDRPIVRGAIDGLAIQVGVPGEAGRWAGNRATGSSLSVGLSLHQNHRIQAWDGIGWRGGLSKCDIDNKYIYLAGRGVCTDFGKKYFGISKRIICIFTVLTSYDIWRKVMSCISVHQSLFGNIWIAMWW